MFEVFILLLVCSAIGLLYNRSSVTWSQDSKGMHAVRFKEESIGAKLCSLRVQGRSPEDKYDYRIIGMNSRLDTLQAAILLPKLKAFADYELEAVNQAAEWYTKRLKDSVLTPVVKPGFYSSGAQYTIMLSDREQRQRVQAGLKEKGIPSMIYYPRGLHRQTAFQCYAYPDALFGNTLRATETILSLPMHPYLTEETVDEICTALLRCL